jgi:hypothetical protein
MITPEKERAVTEVMSMARVIMMKILKTRDEIISRALKDLF